jgi:hypothetical protein
MSQHGPSRNDFYKELNLDRLRYLKTSFVTTGTPVSLDHAMNEGLPLPQPFVTEYGSPRFATAQPFNNGFGQPAPQEQTGSGSEEPETDSSASCSSSPVFGSPPPYAASTKAAPEAIPTGKVSDV